MRCEALVGPRPDFRETSRVLTLFTRDAGRLRVLAKGAHRPDSACLGKVDLWNSVRVDLSMADGLMPLLSRIELLHEPRELRRPARYPRAAYCAELFGRCWLDDRSDPALYDLMLGGRNLLERAPEERLDRVVAGLELRLLRHLGSLSDLGRCGACGRRSPRLAWHPDAGGLACPDHAQAGARPIAPAVLSWLQGLDRSPGARWPAVPDDPPPTAATILGAWLEGALERRMRLRRSAWRGPMPATEGPPAPEPAEQRGKSTPTG